MGEKTCQQIVKQTNSWPQENLRASMLKETHREILQHADKYAIKEGTMD